MTDELQNAMARLRRMRAGEGLEAVYLDAVEMPSKVVDCWLCDKAIVADAYLDKIAAAEQAKAERALPVTEEWLLTLGERSDDGDGVTIKLNPKRFSLYVCFSDKSACIEEYIGTKRYQVAIASELYKTRGQVLDLLAALGVKEQP